METTSSSPPGSVAPDSPAQAKYSVSRETVGTARVVGIGRRPLQYEGRDGWMSRIGYRTLCGAAIGAGTGVFIGSFKDSSVLKTAGIMSTNSALVTLCFCGSQELVREIRASEPDDLVNCVFAGLASGGLLGRMQGGPSRAAPCALLFAVVGTGLQFGVNQFREYRLNRYLNPPIKELVSSEAEKPRKQQVEKESWKFPEWFPIQRFDEEAAARRKVEKEEEFAARVNSLHKGQRP